MAKDFDTSWFDLKNYEVFKTMTAEEWQRQFKMRYLYLNAYLQRQTHDSVRIYDFHKHDRITSHEAVHDDADKYLLSVAHILKTGAIPYDPNYFDRYQYFYTVEEGDAFSTSTSFHKNIYKLGQNVMILLFSGEACHGTKNGTRTIGADGRATAETSQSGRFADSLNAGS